MRERSCIVKKVTEHVVRTYLEFRTLTLVVAVQITAMFVCTSGALANQPQIRDDLSSTTMAPPLDSITTLVDTYDAQSPSNHLDAPLNSADARHLIERTGFGVHPSELKINLGKSRIAAIEQILEGFGTARPTTPYPNFVTQSSLPNYWLRGDLSKEEKRIFNEQRDQEMSSLKLWWMQEMISTPNPQVERLILLWHNHFVSSYDQMDHETHAITYKHLKIRKLGYGNFRDLAKEMLLDASILKYLNNDTNRSAAPNENLARELLELFILGEGNYAEDTVREVAKSLTGYSYNKLKNFEVEFRPWDHDFSEKTIFKLTGQIKGSEVIDILLEQKDAARHITRLFWKSYISEFNFDDAEMERISDVFYHSNYEISVLLREVLSSKAFWDPKNRHTIIKSPIDLLIGSIRSSGQLPDTFKSLPHHSARLGQNLFEQPNVAGWSGGADWITPNRLLMRSEMLQKFEATLNRSIVETSLTREEAMQPMRKEGFIEVRYAAEHFHGAPKFTLEAIKRKNATAETTWISSPQVAQVGIDTAALGRVRYKDLIWSVARIPVPAGLTFDEIGINFINDYCCGPGGPKDGDRNLFIDWVSFENKFAYANQGHQKTCKKDKADKRPGRMYCSGTLRLTNFEQALDQDKERTQSADKALIAERAAFLWANKLDPSKNWRKFKFGVSGLSYAGHSDVSMEFSIVYHLNKGKPRTLLVLNDHNCYPSCFSQPFPASAFKDKHRDSRTIRLVLTGKETKQEAQQWEELSNDSRVLVSIIAANLPKIIEAARHGRHWADRGGEDRLESWQQIFENIDRALIDSRYERLQKGYDFHIEPTRLVSLRSVQKDDIAQNKPDLIAGLSLDKAKLTAEEHKIFLQQLEDPVYQLK